MKNTLRNYILNFLIIIVLTVGALWFALKDNYEEVFQLICGMKWYWLVLILAWGFIYSIVAGWVLSLFGKRYKKDFTFRQGVENGLVGSFFSGITPSATGGQFAQAYIFKKQGIKLSDAASLLWADFIVYQTTMMAYVTVLFILRYRHYMEIIGPLFVMILVGFVINIGVIGVLWTMALFPRMYQKFSSLGVRLLSNMHIIKDKERTLKAWSHQLHSFTKEIQTLKHEKMLIFKTVLINIFRMTLLYSLPFVIAQAIGVNLPYSALLDVIALSSFVSMANAFIPIPGASGGTEAVFVLLFATVLGGANASSIMILWRASTYHLVMLIGASVFLWCKHYYSKKNASNQNLVEDEDGEEQEEFI